MLDVYFCLRLIFLMFIALSLEKGFTTGMSLESIKENLPLRKTSGTSKTPLTYYLILGLNMLSSQEMELLWLRLAIFYSCITITFLHGN